VDISRRCACAAAIAALSRRAAARTSRLWSTGCDGLRACPGGRDPPAGIRSSQRALTLSRGPISFELWRKNRSHGSLASSERLSAKRRSIAVAGPAETQSRARLEDLGGSESECGPDVADHIIGPCSRCALRAPARPALIRLTSGDDDRRSNRTRRRASNGSELVRSGSSTRQVDRPQIACERELRVLA